MFNAAREGTTNSFFSVMQPRLRKQNYIKYVDRSVIDKDLLLRRKQVEISDNCNGKHVACDVVTYIRDS